MESTNQLSPVEARVLGALMEKEMTTPEYYPLSLNALVNACNQKTNRDPVVAYDEAAVREALETLRHRDLARPAREESRVLKFEHTMGEAYNFGRGENAVLCVLLLRGPQTLGEIRERAHRMYEFPDMDALESCLRRLAERDPALVRKLAKQPGWKEARYTHLFCGEVSVPVIETAATPESESRLDRLERELSDLRREFETFKKSFE